MEAGLDSGPILLEREVDIGPDDMASEVAAALSVAGAELLLETLRALAAETLEAHAQDESEVSWAPRLTKSDGYVDWSRPARALYDRLRAFTPWPGLTAGFRGEPVKILDCRPGQDDPAGAAPGTVLAKSPELRIACGDGTVLHLLSLQRPGRRALSGNAFANGERVAVGERFETPPAPAS
jgi:methionyl-tRNA formyltransferase